MANSKKTSSSKNSSKKSSKEKTPVKNTMLAQAEKKAEQIVKSRDNSKKVTKGKGGKKPGGIVQYFKDLRSEFKKVVWASKKTVVNDTSVVLIAMVLSSLVVWGLDSGFSALLKLLVG